MGLKILIKRDTIDNFKTENYVPRAYELTVAYETGTKELIYKLGDGKTSWSRLKEITKLSELDKFIVYPMSTLVPGAELRHSKVCTGVEIYINPFESDQIVKNIKQEPESSNVKGLFSAAQRFIEDDMKAIY